MAENGSPVPSHSLEVDHRITFFSELMQKLRFTCPGIAVQNNDIRRKFGFLQFAHNPLPVSTHPALEPVDINAHQIHNCCSGFTAHTAAPAENGFRCINLLE